jgi:hypothetical protein
MLEGLIKKSQPYSSPQVEVLERVKVEEVPGIMSKVMMPWLMVILMGSKALVLVGGVIIV